MFIFSSSTSSTSSSASSSSATSSTSSASSTCTCSSSSTSSCSSSESDITIISDSSSSPSSCSGVTVIKKIATLSNYTQNSNPFHHTHSKQKFSSFHLRQISNHPKQNQLVVRKDTIVKLRTRQISKQFKTCTFRFLTSSNFDYFDL